VSRDCRYCKDLKKVPNKMVIRCANGQGLSGDDEGPVNTLHIDPSEINSQGIIVLKDRQVFLQKAPACPFYTEMRSDPELFEQARKDGMQEDHRPYPNRS